jgi:DME family drug/metabolite transporter
MPLDADATNVTRRPATVNVLKARLLVLAAAVLFSTGGAAIKSTSLTAWQVASFRSGIAAIAILCMLRGSRRLPDRATWMVGLIYASTMVLFVVANKLTTAANAIYLQGTAPLYILLAAPFLLREPVKRADVLFMGALAVGLGAFFWGVEPARQTAPNPGLGNLAALASGLTWAGTVMGLRWLGRRSSDPSATQPSLVAGNVLACVMTLGLALPIAGIPARDLVILGFLGVFQIGLAYVCLAHGITGVPALEASLLLLLEPVLNPIWAWLVHGEAPGPWALAGGAVIMAATVVRTVWDARVSSRAS